MARRADWEGAKDQFPAYKNDASHWEAFFDQRPDVMWQILGDIAKVYVATDDLTRRVGRRPGVSNMSLDELELIATPRYAMEPIAVSLPELIGRRSQRSFAARVPCHHSTLARFIDGSAAPNMDQLELLADAGRVSPAYFLEWRQLFVAAVLEHVYTRHPNFSIAAFKLLTGDVHVPSPVPERALRDRQRMLEART